MYTDIGSPSERQNPSEHVRACPEPRPASHPRHLETVGRLTDCRIALPAPRRRLFRKGSAFLVVMVVAIVLGVILWSLSETSIQTRYMTKHSADEQKAVDLAEAATHLVYRLVAEDMNDPKMIYKLITFKGLDLDSWFWKFRLPQAMGGVNVEPLSFKNDSISHADSTGDGIGLEFNLGLEMIAKLKKEYDNGSLPDLEDMIKDMGGEVSIHSTAQIKKVYGILPKGKTYDIPGVTVDMKEVNAFADFNVGKLLNSLMGDETFEIDITNLLVDQLPHINFGTIVRKAIDKMGFNFAVYSIAVPIPVGKLLGALFEGLTRKLTGDNLTLKGFLKTTVLKDLRVKIDLTKIKTFVRDKIMGILPQEIRAFAGQANWGITMEKIGVFEVKTTVEYQPKGVYGPKLRKTLLTRRDFRVADVQPIAPDYSFFVANSALTFESPDQENTSGFQGDDQIDWNAGMGRLVIHNLSLMDGAALQQLIDFVGAVASGDLKKMGTAFTLPGRVRINGTKPMEIRLNFGLLDFLGGDATFVESLKSCEVLALLVNDRDSPNHIQKEGAFKPEHEIIPVIQEGIYGTPVEMPPPLGGWIAFFNLTAEFLKNVGAGMPKSFTDVFGDALLQKPFDWPWLCDGAVWIPMPKFYNKTQLFGDFHVEFPLPMRVEGNIWKRFSRVRMPMIRVWIFLNWLFGAPNVDFTLPPIPFHSNVVEPYGFCDYPPTEQPNGKADEVKMNEMWKPNEAHNLPDNLYSPHQYLKKASHYYETTAEFSKDIERRSIQMEVDGAMRDVLVVDGVTFIEGRDGQGLFLRNDLYVMGRGMIVCAGNIHLKSITRVDPPNEGPPTILSLIARNGALINTGKTKVEAACYADRGVMNPFYGDLKIYGNLVVNQFNRTDCQGKVEVFFQSARTHASLLSYFKDFAKYDLTRFHVSMARKWREFQFEKN